MRLRMAMPLALFFCLPCLASPSDGWHEKACLALAKVRGITVMPAETALASTALHTTEEAIMAQVAPKTRNLRYVEIGPGDNPLCLNCLLVEPATFSATESADISRRAGGSGEGVAARAQNLPLASQSVESIVARHFDIVGNLTIDGKPSPQARSKRKQSLAECYRVLKPGKSFLYLMDREHQNMWTDEGGISFPTPEESVAYQTALVIRDARAVGFIPRIIVTEKHMGLELTRPR